MNPSYNDSFGSFGVSGGTGGSGSVISSGGDSGEPVMFGGGVAKRGKKWIWAVILGVAIVAIIIGVVIALMNSRNGDGGTEDSKNADFYTILNENKEPIANLVSAVRYIYSGEASIADFVISSQDELDSNVAALNDGISALEKLNERLVSGPELSGTVAETNLEENYEGLKNAVLNDLEKYRSFATLTTRLYQVSRNLSSAQEILSGYGVSATSLAEEIQSYYNSRATLISRYSESNCANAETVVCNSIMAELLALQENIDVANPAIFQVYIANVGEINYGEVESVMYYFDNLYAAIGEGDDAEQD